MTVNLPPYLFPENMQLEKEETLKIQKMKILGTHFFSQRLHIIYWNMLELFYCFAQRWYAVIACKGREGRRKDMPKICRNKNISRLEFPYFFNISPRKICILASRFYFNLLWGQPLVWSQAAKCKLLQCYWWHWFTSMLNLAYDCAINERIN